MTTPTSHARTFAPDPGCSLCCGLGTRHIARGMITERVSCPCTLIGPELKRACCNASCQHYLAACVSECPECWTARLPASRSLSELPPIEDTAVLDQYPDCQPRTPIDPVTTVRSPGLMRGNSDLQPAQWAPRQYRECPGCEGKGVVGKIFKDGTGQAMCTQCMGAGSVKL